MYYRAGQLVYSGKTESGASFFFFPYFFLGVSFPVFTESGEEQHFLRGEPAFRSLSSLPSPEEQKGGGESAEEVEMLCLQFMFSTRRRVNTGVEKPGMCTRVHGCVSDKGAHAKTKEPVGGGKSLLPRKKK